MHSHLWSYLHQLSKKLVLLIKFNHCRMNCAKSYCHHCWIHAILIELRLSLRYLAEIEEWIQSIAKSTVSITRWSGVHISRGLSNGPASSYVKSFTEELHTRPCMVTKRRRVWNKTCCMGQGHFMLHFTTFYHVYMYMKWAQKLVMRSSILAKFLKLNLKALRILGCGSFRPCSYTSWCIFMSYNINRYQLHKIACKCQTWCNQPRINGDIHWLHAIQWFIITKLVHNKVTIEFSLK